MSKNHKQEIEREWTRISIRRMSYQKFRLYQYGLFQGYRKAFGYSQRYSLARVKEGVAYYFTDQQESTGFTKFLIDKFTSKNYAVRTLKRLADDLENNFNRCADDIKKLNRDWSEASGKQLIAALDKFRKIDNSASVYYWILFDSIEAIIAESLALILQVGNIPENKIKRALSLLARPTLKIPLDLERLSILKVALLAGEDKERALKEHHSTFAFLPMYDIDYDEYPLSHFKKELRKIETKYSRSEIKSEIRQIEQKYRQRERENAKFLKQFAGQPDVLAILHFYQTFANFKDRKPFVRDQVGFHIKNLFMEIAGRLKLSLTEVLYLADTELMNALEGKSVTRKKALASRIADSVFFMHDDQVTIVTGKRALRKIDRLLDEKSEAGELKGISASPGLIRGRVSIVLSNADFRKFKKSDILVTPATRPDYLPIMKQAAAIITDEGGLLCHAAIVSRELKIPCVVGLKTATHHLKDGDLVEVDADNGSVRKI